MTIHALTPISQEAPPPQEADSSATSTAYDSIWAGGKATGPAAAQGKTPPEQSAFEQTMLSHDKLYVVLAVVLLVWLGVATLLFRTDRRLAALERQMDDTK